jgi:hypothetical protein
MSNQFAINRINGESLVCTLSVHEYGIALENGTTIVNTTHQYCASNSWLIQNKDIAGEKVRSEGLWWHTILIRHGT